MNKLQKTGLILIIIGLIYWVINGIFAITKISPQTCVVIGGKFAGILALIIFFIGLGLIIFNRKNSEDEIKKVSKLQKITQILLLINILFYGLGAYAISRSAIDVSFFIIISAFIVFIILLTGVQLLKRKLFNVAVWLGLILSSISIAYIVYLAAISSF